MPKGIFAGLATIDVIYEVERFPAPDEKVTAKTQSVYVGGPATNAAIAFRYLGGEATLMAVVGQHPLSGLIRDELERYGVELHDLDPGFEDVPAISSVAVNEVGERRVISANATRMKLDAPEADAAMCRDAAVLLVDGHSMEACQAWARKARAIGTRVVMDGGSWKPGSEELLEQVDVAICSADFHPPGTDEPEQTIRYLQERGVREVAVTDGAGPIRFACEGISGWISTPEVEVVDTTGAGDILHGAFCYYAASGLNFRDALEQAAKIASESCRYRGTREWMKGSDSQAGFPEL